MPTLPASQQLANDGETIMTRTEFLSWAKAARLRNTSSLEAARFVLTGNMRPGEAAKAAGCSPQSVTNTLRKIKDVMTASRAGDASFTAPRISQN
ncbi:hypothetical protein D3C87_1076830 [compost metagenome]